MEEWKAQGGPLRILHLEDSPADAEIIRERLADFDGGIVVDWASNEREFIELLHRGGHDLVLADYHLPALEGVDALRLARSIRPNLPFICVSGAIGDERAVELLRQGATDYVLKNHLFKLPMVMRRALDEAREREERHAAEVERERLEARLRQAHKMEAVGRLAGGVAHDFNNMLQVILGNVELVMMEIPPGSPLRENIEEIRICAQRSADLTRQLLAFARKETIAPKVVDLNDMVEGALRMIKRLTGDQITLVWRPGAGLRPVRIDPSQFDQILVNLCVNARDAGAKSVVIESGEGVFDEAYCSRNPWAVPGEYVRISVADDGRGMDRDTLEKLFEPFFTTKEMGKGTGLGLATVYGSVKQNNGFIDVRSEPGRGTTFSIYLPAERAPVTHGVSSAGGG